MREIKFRYWDMVRKEFITDGDVYFVAEDAIFAGDFNNPPLVDVTGHVQMSQFTGLHDKNGVDIYEGDIVKLNSVNLRIYYSENRALYRAEGSNKWHYDINEIMEFYNCEIIGNIYENPELTEQK